MNLFKRDKKANAPKVERIAVAVLPDHYQLILNIPHDGKTASLIPLQENGKTPVPLLMNGLLMVYNQIVQNVGIEKYKQEVRNAVESGRVIN